MTEASEVLKQNPDFTVVCVDDEEEILHIQCKMIESLGLKVFATTSPEEVLTYLRAHQHEIALVLSDYHMPKINGFELRKQIVKISPTIPFIIISATVSREMALQAVDLKIAGFLEKPFHLEHLTDLVNKEVVPRIETLKEEKELLEGFVLESSDLIERSEEAILALEKNPNSIEALNLLFGNVHTLKGASSFFHPKTMHQFTHRFEDFLKKLQKGELLPTPGLISAMLQALDTIKFLIADLHQHQKREFDVEKEISRIFKADLISPAPVLNRALTAVEPKHDVEKPTEIKIPLTTLHEFIQLSGEMTVIRNMLNRCLRNIEKSYTGDKDVSTLGELLQELHKINAGIQDKISHLRKVSIRQAFKPLSRGARDVARALQKEIEVQFSGEEITVDTSISELLSKILFHLIKNSIDHGVEMPEERVSKGKPAKGTIAIHASIQNENVVIEIKDDGRGINEEALKRKAIQNNLFTPDQINTMSREDIHRLIFEAGLSTAAAVTDVSGRGVGMSMVKTTVEDANGAIEIVSSSAGTMFKILLPIPQSLLITNCLFIQCGKYTFGLQQKEIFRILRLSPAERKQLLPLPNSMVLNLEGQLVPVVSLATLMEFPDRQPFRGDREIDLLVIQSDAHAGKLALQVDGLSDIEDTVIKAVIPHVNQHQLYLGATFMYDGTVGLILDAAGLFQKAKIEPTKKRHASQITATVHANEATEEKILLVDLMGPSGYAIPHSQVYRIEKLSGKAFHFVGKQAVISYRGKALPLIDLNEKIRGEPLGPAETLNVVVVQTSRGLLGLRVRRANNFVAAPPADRTHRYHPLALGTVLLQDRVITVIDAEALALAPLSETNVQY